jgi:hypothetical protein
MRRKPDTSRYPRYIEKTARALEHQVTTKGDPYANAGKKQTHLIHEKMDKVPPLTGKDVEDPLGHFSTELNAYKVRGEKTAGRQWKGGK